MDTHGERMSGNEQILQRIYAVAHAFIHCDFSCLIDQIRNFYPFGFIVALALLLCRI